MCHGSLPSRPITPFCARATTRVIGGLSIAAPLPLSRAPCQARYCASMTDGEAQLIAAGEQTLGPKAVITDPSDIEPWVSDWRGRVHGASPRDARAGLDRRGRRDRQARGRASRAARPAGRQYRHGRGRDAARRRLGAILLSMRRMNRIRSIERRGPARGRGGGRGPRHAARGCARSRHALPADARRARQLHDRRPHLDQRRRHAGAEVRHDARARRRASRRCCPTARIHNGLSGLKKDNRGYSLDQLLIGAEGTLGVVTAVALRLVPAIAARAVAWAGVESPTRALDLLRFLEARTDSIEGFELVPEDSPAARAQAHPGHARRRLPASTPGTCCRSDDAPTPAIDIGGELERLLGAALEQGIIGDAVIAASEAQAEAFWKIRDSISEAERAEGPDARARHLGRRSPTCRASSSRPRQQVERAFPGVVASGFGHLGDGNIHFHVRAGSHAAPGLVRRRRRADHALRRRSGHRGRRLDLGRARHRPVEARRVRPPRRRRAGSTPCARSSTRSIRSAS